MKLSFQSPTFKEWGQPDGNDTMHSSGMKKAMCRIAVLLAGLVLLAGSAATSAQEKDNEINGKVPEYPTVCLDSELHGEKSWVKGDGLFIQVEPGNRAPGTRSPVHTHPNGGATCVIQGQMTLILEGDKDQTFYGDIWNGLVQCYPMPAPVNKHDENKMTALNTGKKVALIIDIFPVPETDNKKPMAFKPLCVLQNKDLGCYKTGSGCPEK